MKSEHKRIIPQRICSLLKDKYKVTCTRKENYLPTLEDHLYEPDIIVWDKKGKKILKIIEIEGDPIRKSIVGAPILADYCIKMRNKKENPEFYFLIYDEKGIRQIESFKARLKIVNNYISNIKKPIIGTTEEIFRLLK